MPGRRATQQPSTRTPADRTAPRRNFAAALLLSLLIAASLSGCQWFRPPRGGGLFGGGWPWQQQQPCVFSPDVATAQLVEHLNRNISRVRAWQCTDGQVRIRGTPAPLSAQIAVESPKNFRMVVGTGLTGQEADLGSNGNRLWFWTRRSRPELIFTARHDQMPQLRGRVALPFQPEWLMEVLGVVPIDAAAIADRKPVDGKRLVRLVSEQTSLDGNPVRRHIVVDTCRGRIVAHELFDASDKLIAQATLSDYRVDADGGVALPHKLDVSWPSADMAMTLNLRRVDVNPKTMPENLWQLPETRGATPFDVVLQMPLDRTALASDAAAELELPPALPAFTAEQRSPFEPEERTDIPFPPREPRPDWAKPADREPRPDWARGE